MTAEEKLAIMKAILGPEAMDSDNDTILSYYLDFAETAIMNRRYPFGVPTGAEIESQYEQLQVEIAIYLFNKRGAEGESLHSENGVSRSFGGETGIPKELMVQVTPRGRVYA